MSVSRNFGPLDQIPLTTRSIMRDVGLLARERIVRRTRAGRDTFGQPFRAYSQGYAARKGAELGTTRPNLTVSGAMLNDLAVLRVDENHVLLGWTR